MFPPVVLNSLIELLRSIVLGVMRPLGDRVRKAPPCRPEHKLIPEPLVVLIQGWLQTRRQMIEALIRRIGEGKHVGRAYKPRELKPDAAAKPRAPIPPEKQLPPRVFGWINHMASEIGPSVAAMGHLIGQPEMRAMIEASPQLVRLWVPLLNAVGVVRPDWWPKPPPGPKRPRRPRLRAEQSVVAEPDPATAPLPALPRPLPQHGTWTAPQPPPPPPRRVTNYRELIESLRPVSQNFEPPPSEWVIVRPPHGKPG